MRRFHRPARLEIIAMPLSATFRPLLTLLVFVGWLGMPPAARAWPAATPPAGTASMRPLPTSPNPVKQLQRLTRELQLTPQQGVAIAPILQGRLQQIARLRNDAALSENDRRAQLRAVMLDCNRRLQAVLTDSQRQQYRQMLQRARARQHARQAEQDAGAMTSPPTDAREH
jgi:hypothetical protein